MSKKMTDAELRKKCRSLETMLSRERVLARSVTVIAESAVKALEDSSNGEIKEAVRTLREAEARLRAEADGIRTAAAAPAESGAAAGSEG